MLKCKDKAKDMDTIVKAKAKDFIVSVKDKDKDLIFVLKDISRPRPRPMTNNTASYHIRQLRQIRTSLDENSAIILA